MKDHLIDDHDLNPVPDDAPEALDAALCPECEGVGTLASGETCPVCEGTGKPTGRTGGG